KGVHEMYAGLILGLFEMGLSVEKFLKCLDFDRLNKISTIRSGVVFKKTYGVMGKLTGERGSIVRRGKAFNLSSNLLTTHGTWQQLLRNKYIASKPLVQADLMRVKQDFLRFGTFNIMSGSE
ncbi:hypothetical protein ACJX0J_018456, partial [Zea mays]